MAPLRSFKSLFSPSPSSSSSTTTINAPRPIAAWLAEMVGKSNKFDFSNRAISGVKLGLVIAETFRKEVDKAQKDSDRQAAKKAKRISAGAAAADAGKDIGVHIIDFKAPSKELGDNGVLAMAPGLYDAVTSGSMNAFICLEDINLQGNGLTAMALHRLGAIINVSMTDLKTLNFSHNNVKVETPFEALDWEMFLKSFSGCFKLRRLDLSGNKLGSLAFEILARVYENEPPITPLRLGGDTSVYSLDDDFLQHKEDKQYAMKIAGKGNKATPAERSMADARLFKRRRGLRSLPYLDLTDTGLDDAGALWLSFILSQHYLPEQLIDGINGAAATSSVGIYQQDQNSHGIEWNSNEDSLGIHGLDLLSKVEAIRMGTLQDNPSITSSGDMCQETVAFDAYIHSCTSFVRQDESNSRRPSVPFAHAITDYELDTASVDRMRHRIQRQIINQHSTRSVELWHAAIRMISVSRRLMILAQHHVDIIHLQTSVPRPSNTKRPHPLRSVMTAPHLDTTAAADTDSPLTDVTNRPQTPYVDSAGRIRRNQAVAVSTLSKSLQKTKIKGPSKEQYMEWQMNYHREKIEASHNIPWILPFRIFKTIANHSMMPSEIVLLTEKQQRAAYEWGQDRTMTAMGKEWCRLNESAQILKLLDHIGCLVYEAHN